jgi:hypothetical protein
MCVCVCVCVCSCVCVCVCVYVPGEILYEYCAYIHTHSKRAYISYSLLLGMSRTSSSK